MNGLCHNSRFRRWFVALTRIFVCTHREKAMPRLGLLLNVSIPKAVYVSSSSADKLAHDVCEAIADRARCHRLHDIDDSVIRRWCPIRRRMRGELWDVYPCHRLHSKTVRYALVRLLVQAHTHKGSSRSWDNDGAVGFIRLATQRPELGTARETRSWTAQHLTATLSTS